MFHPALSTLAKAALLITDLRLGKTTPKNPTFLTLRASGAECSKNRSCSSPQRKLEGSKAAGHNAIFRYDGAFGDVTSYLQITENKQPTWDTESAAKNP